MRSIGISFEAKAITGDIRNRLFWLIFRIFEEKWLIFEKQEGSSLPAFPAFQQSAIYIQKTLKIS